MLHAFNNYKLFCCICAETKDWRVATRLAYFNPAIKKKTQALPIKHLQFKLQLCGTGGTYLVCHLIDAGNHASSVQGSVMGASRMDNSYVVLSRQNRSQGPRIPPRPPSAAAPHTEPSQPTRAIEGSYIVLPPPAASIYKTPASEGGGAQLTPPGVNSSSPSSPGNNSGFHSSVTVLKRAFEIASSQTQVQLIA